MYYIQYQDQLKYEQLCFNLGEGIWIDKYLSFPDLVKSSSEGYYLLPWHTRSANGQFFNVHLYTFLL
jgi:hypothetical protein